MVQEWVALCFAHSVHHCCRILVVVLCCRWWLAVRLVKLVLWCPVLAVVAAVGGPHRAIAASRRFWRLLVAGSRRR